MSILDKIDSVRKKFLAEIESLPESPTEVQDFRSRYFGRKGQISILFSQMADIASDQRPIVGKSLNTLRQDLTIIFENKINNMGSFSTSKNKSFIDLTLPAIDQRIGSMHILEQTLSEIKSIYQSIGFHIAYGPEVDDDYHNFTALNTPEHHPARDMQDTFYVESDVVLRTHTSNVQVHLMEQQDPPIRYIVPGRVYRNEAIGYKSYCLFHQVEGIYINNYVSFGELKGCLEYFIKQMFGPKKKMRFRPSYFPFTEPSAEVDIWDEERNKWMEILGCGMVDPAVLDNVGYDSTNLRGYAFGMGVERIAMLKHKVDDIRHFYTGDLRFLEQFI